MFEARAEGGLPRPFSPFEAALITYGAEHHARRSEIHCFQSGNCTGIDWQFISAILAV